MEKIVLNTAEACKLLDVCAPTLRAWCRSENHPPFVRVGRSYRFPKKELLEWLARISMEG